MMERVADVLRPMMLRPPPALGSAHPGDVLELLREAGRAAGLSPPRAAGALPRDDDVGRRPARRLVRERRAQGRLRLDRRGRRLGRPAHARHRLQPAAPRARRARRRRRRVGPRASGGMGAISEAIAASAPARSARSSAPTPPVASIDVAGGRVTGVTLADGEAITRADRPLRRAPEDDRARPRRRRALPRRGRRGHAPLPLPRRLREGQLDPVRAAALRATSALLHTSLAICPSIDYLERAWQDATLGKPAAGPYIEVEVPTAIDPSLTDDGTTVMTMFTQYGPHDEAGWPEGAREAYAQRCLDIIAQLRAERPRRGRSTTRCSRRPTSSGSSGSSAARSSRASRAWTRWRSCARRRCSRATRRRSTASTCAAPGRTRAAA